MKFKYYLRGAGIGVIITTLILMIAFPFSKSNTPEPVLSDAEIIARAEALGMVMLDYDSTDNDNIEPDKSEEKTDELVPSIENIEEVVEPNDEELANEEGSVTRVTYKAFTISGGQGSLQVAKNLQDEGLISDAEKFNKFIISAGLDSRLQPGTFYIEEGISEEDLAVILVTKQADRVTNLPR